MCNWAEIDSQKCIHLYSSFILVDAKTHMYSIYKHPIQYTTIRIPINYKSSVHMIPQYRQMLIL